MLFAHGSRFGGHALYSSDPVTADYPGGAPFRFSGGTIKRVAVDVSEPHVDLEREAVAMMSRE